MSALVKRAGVVLSIAFVGGLIVFTQSVLSLWAHMALPAMLSGTFSVEAAKAISPKVVIVNFVRGNGFFKITNRQLILGS
jgi:hypothetical protein